MTATDHVGLVSAELAELIHDVSRRLRTVAHAEANVLPLPDSERDVLRLVHRRPGVRIGEVARELRMKNSNVSTAVRNLVQQGLLVRAADANDRRVGRLTTTGLAEQNMRRLERSWDRHLGAAVGQLAADERAALGSAVPALRSLLAVLSDAERRPS
jgi:DNA-binding MarR family transcriptional regulator